MKIGWARDKSYIRIGDKLLTPQCRFTKIPGGWRCEPCKTEWSDARPGEGDLCGRGGDAR